MSGQDGVSTSSLIHRRDFATAVTSSHLGDLGHSKGLVWKPKSPELRRRKYSLSSVMRRLEKKSDETKEELREKKLQKRELTQNNKHVKRGIFSLRSRQNNNNNKTIPEECNENGVSLIPPVPSELGYNDLFIEEVEKPRSSSIIHASENVLLSDVQRQRSPRSSRSQRSPRLRSKLGKSNSAPPTPQRSPSSTGARHNLSPLHTPRTFRFDSGYDENGEKSPLPSPNSTSCRLSNAVVRRIAYSSLSRVLQDKQFNAKHVESWSKKITEEILLEIRRLTKRQRKIVVSVFLGEKFPGTVEVFVSSPRMTENDNFQTVSIQINDIFAWVSVISTNV